jgi:hypothetical protein
MQLNFNANDFDPTQGGSICFPLADYKVEITAVEPKVVKDNPNAGYLAVSLTVVEGDMRGMVQVDRLNIFSDKEVPKRIAHQQLAAYAFAINRPFLQTTEQMIGGRLIATIGPQADDPKYSEVKVVKCPDGSFPQRPPQGGGGVPQQGQQAAPAAPAQQQPWGGAAAAAQPGWAAPAAPAAPVGQAAPPWGGAAGAAAPVAPTGAAAAPPWATQNKQ